MRAQHRLQYRTNPTGSQTGACLEYERAEKFTPVDTLESEIPSITSTMKSVTRYLREGFKGIGVTRLLLLGNTNLYELAVNGLAGKISRAPIPDNFKSGAVKELSSLSSTLAELFSGRLPTKHMRQDNSGRFKIEGYYEDPSGSTFRTCASILPEHTTSNTGDPLRPSTQILIKEISGKNTRGKAIAGEDGGLRIGMRYSGSTWVISIDSGAQTNKGRWRVIYPLSQAVEAMKIAQVLPHEDKPFTYHFNTPPITSLRNKEYSTEGFTDFNFAIGTLLINRARRSTVYELS